MRRRTDDPHDRAPEGGPLVRSRIRRLTLLAAALLAALLLLARWPARLHEPPTSLPTLSSVRTLARLVTQEVQVGDVITARLQGYTGTLEAILVVRGSALVGVDLERAQLTKVDRPGRSLTLTLPGPTVTHARVDHEHTRLHAVSASGLWLLVPADKARARLVDHLLRQAQGVVSAAALCPRLREHAKRHAEGVIGAFFESMGWSVAIRWQS